MCDLEIAPWKGHARRHLKCMQPTSSCGNRNKIIKFSKMAAADVSGGQSECPLCVQTTSAAAQQRAPEREYNFLCSHVGQLSARREPFFTRRLPLSRQRISQLTKCMLSKASNISNTLAPIAFQARFIYNELIGWKKRRRPANAESQPSTQTHHNIF
jgi:hypothetical protein